MDLKLGKLTQLTWPVTDVDRTVEFFRDKLGVAFLFRPHENMAFFDLDGVRLYVDKAASPEQVAQASILYLRVEDIMAATAALRAHQVEIAEEPHLVARLPSHDLWMTFFKDPDGHLLAIEMQAPSGWAPA